MFRRLIWRCTSCWRTGETWTRRWSGFLVYVTLPAKQPGVGLKVLYQLEDNDGFHRPMFGRSGVTDHFDFMRARERPEGLGRPE